MTAALVVISVLGGAVTTGTAEAAPPVAARAEATAEGLRLMRASAAPVRGRVAPTALFTSRVTAQPRPVKDRSGRIWARLPAALGSASVSTKLSRADIGRTQDDVLYRANVWGTPGYVLPVPAKGRYVVRLHLVEDTFTRPGQRVFDVVAEGRTVVRGLDIVRAVGPRAAHIVSIPVAVTDGRLDLRFVDRTDRPAIAAIEVLGTTPVATSLLTAPLRHELRLAKGNIFQRSVRSAPLARNSAATAAFVTRQVTGQWNGVAAVNAYQFNVGFHRVPAGTKRITIGYDNCQRKTGVPAGLYTGRKHFVGVPVPANAISAVGTDREMTIYDPATDQMWDLWQMRRHPSTGAWRACWGGRMDQVSTQTQLAFPDYFGTAASGLSLAAGMVSVEDALRGRIDHAVAITVIDAARWDKPSWPAVRSDGLSTNRDAVREGQRLRLDPRLDLDRYNLTPFGRMVAQAAQEYGFIVVDKAGAVAVQTEFGVQQRINGRDAWDSLLGGPSYTAMRNFPWRSLQALPVDYGRTTTR